MLAGSSLAAGVASASGTQGHPPARSALASLAYRCRFPSGPRSVRAAVRASLPAAGRTGKPIQPARVSLTLAVPSSAAASLHSATVSAVTSLTISASEGPSGISIVWPGTTRSPVPRPAHGTLTLTTVGAVPAVATNSAGDVILTAAGLSVTLIAGKAAAPQPSPAGTPTPTGTPTPARTATPAGTPAVGSGGRGAVPAPAAGSLQVTCALAAGQDATLGTVLITGKTTGAAGAGGRSATKPLCPKLPPGGLKLNPRFPPPKPPKGSTIGSSPSQGCAFTAGYADARKLKGAAFVQPGLTNVDLFVRTATDFNLAVNYAEFDSAAQLDFQGKHEFPPSTATFLTFGFAPTTATIELVEHGTINIFAIGPAIPSQCPPPKSCDTVATVASQLSVQIVPGSVKVNGVPLNVGSNCGTPPFDAILTGTSASVPPYNVVTGGPITGLVSIPPFQNCGVGENLDPLFNAAISGNQNFNLLTQGPVCFLLGGGVCGKTGPVLPNPILHEVIG